MLRYLHSLARLGCAMPLLACASENDPTAPAATSRERVPIPALSTSESEPTEADLASMPSAFMTAPSLVSARVIAGFVAGEGAFAQALMDYFGTNAEQDATITVMSGATQTASRTGRSSSHDFLPAVRSLTTTVSFPFAGSCGHLAEARGVHRAWHQFLVGGWKFLSWGQAEQPSDAHEWQDPCPEPGEGESGSESDPYEAGCEVCQQWFYFGSGRFTSWWEC